MPPKALSLNGELGLAFGARGRGGKDSGAAHYEPASVVINLTKKQGSGSLAHEWFHALDNYFSNIDTKGKDVQSSDFMTQIGRKMGIFKDGKYQRATADDFGVRLEVYEAFKKVSETIKKDTKLTERSA